MPIEDLMWVEKYRPSDLSELVDQVTIRQKLKQLMEKKEQLPHLLFAGPPGSGKTTTAMILAKQILGEHWRDYTLSLNASDERGIDVVRERIKTFARFADRREGVPFRLAILDECDEMTNDGQTALRRIMEENSEHTRFILICNYSSGIIEPLQSRCAIFRFQRLDEASVAEHLKSIAKKEKLKHSGDAVFGAIYEATQGDLRQAINLMQTASAEGEITTESVKSVSGASIKARVAEIIGLAIEGDFDAARTKMVELTRVYGIPERDFLRFANEALGSLNVPDMAKAISILAEYDYRLVQGSQPELQLTAMLAQLSAMGKKAD
ncbi:MAG TPA: replication factor C small subunit [Nitrososphaerales archaeon]|nr:replication factor C small subunit [Nitrososphaerales archaeon]